MTAYLEAHSPRLGAKGAGGGIAGPLTSVAKAGTQAIADGASITVGGAIVSTFLQYWT